MIKKFYQDEFSRSSSFNDIFKQDHFYIYENYFNQEFSKLLSSFLVKNELIKEGTDLKKVHESIDEKLLEPFLEMGYNNRRSIFSQKLFEFVEQEDTKQLYLNMLSWLNTKYIKEDFYFQNIPTIRVHMPDSKEKLNLPAWHSDSFLGHSPREMNVWFGLTDNIKSDFFVINLEKSSQWFKESNYNTEEWNNICHSGNLEFNNKGYLLSEEVRDIYNSIFLFDSRCIHAAKNRSDEDYSTKFSIDYRIILKKDYDWKLIDGKPVFVGKGIKKAEFKVGEKYGYYEKSIREIINEKREGINNWQQ